MMVRLTSRERADRRDARGEGIVDGGMLAVHPGH